MLDLAGIIHERNHVISNCGISGVSGLRSNAEIGKTESGHHDRNLRLLAAGGFCLLTDIKKDSPVNGKYAQQDIG